METRCIAVVRCAGLLCAAAVLSLAATPAPAVDTEFTANVLRPDGNLDFAAEANWSVKKPDTLPQLVNSQFSAGLNESFIPSQMESDLEVFTTSFDTSVSGETLRVDGAFGWVDHTGGELSITVTNFGTGPIPLDTDQITTQFTGDSPIPPSFTDFLTAFKIEDNPGASSASDLSFNLVIDGVPITDTDTASVGAGDTAADLTTWLDATLSSATLPTGVDYEGLVSGSPVISSDSGSISVSMSVTTADGSPSQFRVGHLILPPVPEPTSLALLGLGAAALIARRRRA